MTVAQIRQRRQKNRSRKMPKKKTRETVDGLLRGLDLLLAQAEGSELGTAARIFHTAREELVHWAVTMNFHESAGDRFINRRLYGGGAEAFIVKAISGAGVELDMVGLLKSALVAE